MHQYGLIWRFFEDTKFRGIRRLSAQNRQIKISDSLDKCYIDVKPIIS